MKRILLFVCLLCLGSLQAQIYHEDDKEGLRVFLRQPSAEEGKLNLEQIGLTIQDTLNWNSSEEWVKKIPVSNGYPNKGIGWNSGNNGINKRIIQIILYNHSLLEKPTYEGFLNCLYFKELTHLYVWNNKLTGINTSLNQKLIAINCGKNQIKEMDVSKSVDLVNLDLGINQLKKIDLSQNKKLVILWLHNNQLTEVDITNIPNLLDFSCGNNQISYLNISNNNQIRALWTNDNINIKELDLKDKTNLIFLHCGNNSLNKLEITNSNKLDSILCYGNNLTKLDLSGNTLLKKVDLKDNTFKFSTLPKNIYSTYIYNPQKTIWGGELEAGKEINLSSEYSINGKTTSFEWFKNNQPIGLSNPANGVFVANNNYVGDTLVCKMKNESFPKLTLEYKVFITKAPLILPVLKDHVKLKYNNSILLKHAVRKNQQFRVYVKTDMPDNIKIGIFEANNNKIFIERIDTNRDNFEYICSISDKVLGTNFVIMPYIETNEGKVIVNRTHNILIDKLPINLIREKGSQNSIATYSTENPVIRNMQIRTSEEYLHQVDVDKEFMVYIPVVKNDSIKIGLFSPDGNLQYQISIRKKGDTYICKVPLLTRIDNYIIMPYVDTKNGYRIIEREENTQWMDRLPLAVNDDIWAPFNANINKVNQSLNEQKNVKIYPNPTQDKVYINSDNKIKALELYNFNGQLIKKVDNAKELSLEDLNPGVYNLKVKTEKEIKNYNIRKE